MRLRAIVLYLKSTLLFFWLIITSIICTGLLIFKWGDYGLNQAFARTFAWGALKLMGVQVIIEGQEYLDPGLQPCIYIVNHQSGLDMATMGGIYPNRTVLIGKKEVLWIPVFGFFYWAAGNVIINRNKSAKAVAGLNHAVERIRKDKVSIWIFPEGTRNKVGDELLPFKRGAFHMALQAGVPLVPIVCGSLKSLVNWETKTLKPGTVKVKVLPPIDLRGFTEKDIEQIVSNAYGQMSEAFHSLSV